MLAFGLVALLELCLVTPTQTGRHGQSFATLSLLAAHNVPALQGLRHHQAGTGVGLWICLGSYCRPISTGFDICT